MNKSFILLVFFAMSVDRVSGQEDSALLKRLSAVMEATQKSDFNTLFDHTYPKLFTIAPREQMLELFKSALENNDYSISFDSLNVIKIFPVFVVDGESFTKIKHTMRMKMKFKVAVDTSNADIISERKETITYMESKFGEGNIRYDKSTDALIVSQIAYQVAIKVKKDHEWYFVNLDDDSPDFLNYLFSKPVIEKLATYK